MDVSHSWGLHMNTIKCIHVRFGKTLSIIAPESYMLKNVPILSKENAKDLDILIELLLKFQTHVHSIVNISGGLSCYILRFTIDRSPELLLPLYISHIRSIIEYSFSLRNMGYISDFKN